VKSTCRWLRLPLPLPLPLAARTAAHADNHLSSVWFSDDGGRSYELAKHSNGSVLQIWGQDEIALAETPDGGVITSTRNEDYHSG